MVRRVRKEEVKTEADGCLLLPMVFCVDGSRKFRMQLAV